MATSLLSTFNGGLGLVPEKMYEKQWFWGVEQLTVATGFAANGWTATALSAGTIAYDFQGDRPALKLLAGAAGRGYQFQHTTAAIQTQAGKALTLSASFRLSAYTQAAFAFGLTQVNADLYTNFLDGTVATITDYIAVAKYAAGTKPQVAMKESAGTLQTISFGDDAGANDTWYDIVLSVTQDSTTAKKGTVSYGQSSAGTAGAAMTYPTTQIAASNFPSGVTLAPFFIFYDPTGASNCYVHQFSLTMDR